MPTSTGASLIRGRRRVLWIAGPLVLLAAAFGLYIFALSPSSGGSSVDQAALRYAGQQIVWNQGPTVQSTHIVRLGDLQHTLAAATPPRVANDVNVPALIQRYGAGRQVALVVLSGEFNSLPPDEGVVARGDVVVLVDTKTNRALYVND